MSALLLFFEYTPCSYTIICSHTCMQLLKDLERIAGSGDFTMEIVSSWNTWAQRIMELKVDSPKSSVRSEILADYDHENPGMYVIIALHACTYTDR